MNPIAEKLRAARKLIEPEGAWTQGTWARNAEGKRVDPDSPAAVCWCAMGACALGFGVHFVEVENHPAFAVLADATGSWPAEFNDLHDQSEVLAAFDRAIEIAESGK